MYLISISYNISPRNKHSGLNLLLTMVVLAANAALVFTAVCYCILITAFSIILLYVFIVNGCHEFLCFSVCFFLCAFLCNDWHFSAFLIFFQFVSFMLFVFTMFSLSIFYCTLTMLLTIFLCFAIVFACYYSLCNV